MQYGSDFERNESTRTLLQERPHRRGLLKIVPQLLPELRSYQVLSLGRF